MQLIYTYNYSQKSTIKCNCCQLSSIKYHYNTCKSICDPPREFKDHLHVHCMNIPVWIGGETRECS